MATIHIEQVLKVGLTEEHNSTQYQASFDEDFEELIHDVDSNYDLHTHSFPVMKDGEIYLGDDEVYTRFRVRIGEDYSEWFYPESSKRSDIDELNSEALQALLDRLDSIKIF
jgi:hypothetical protein